MVERWSPPAGKAPCPKTGAGDKPDELAAGGARFSPGDAQGGCGSSFQQPGAETSEAGTGKSPPNCPVRQRTPEGPLKMKGPNVFLCDGLEYYDYFDVS